MHIVVLDSHTLNPGDLDWQALEALGKVTLHPRTAPGERLARCLDADAVLTNKVPLDADLLAQLPRLRYIGVIATGYNVIDTAAARARGIVVTNVPAYSTRSVAQMVFAHILAHCQRVEHYADDVHGGSWTRSPDFCYWDTPLQELADQTLGLVGFGQIGQATAALGVAFGMRVIVATRSPIAAPPVGVTPASLDTVFATSDVVSLHCPLTPATTGLVNAARLATMKSTALLINTGRGPLVDEAALAAALHAGTLAGAGLDVLSTEPPRPDNPLLGAPRCTITPHLAWATPAARRRLLGTVVANLAAFQHGQSRNVVN